MAQDDFDPTYGTADPTALFQNLQRESMNSGAVGGAMRDSAMLGGNPQIQHATAVRQRLSQILSQANTEMGTDPSLDPLDRQMKIAERVATGMSGIAPDVSVRADQQMIKLQQAKTQQARLNAETELTKQQMAEARQKVQAQATDPMINVQTGKDSFGLATYTPFGKPVQMYDEQGNLRTGWSNDLAAEGQGQQGLMPMRQSQYLQLVEKLNPLRAEAMIRAQQMRAMQLMGGLVPPEGWDARAQQVVEGLAAPMQPPVNTRNPAAVQNYENYLTAIRRQGIEPGDINENVYKENALQLAKLDHGPQADLVRSFNVAVQHTQVLKKYFAAQQNGDIPAKNAIENWWMDNTGKPIPTTVAAMNEFVADEWVKGIVGQRPALADRIQAQEKASRNNSPEAFNSIMDGWAALGAGQLSGLRQEMLSGLRKANGDSWDQGKLDAMWYGDKTHMGKVAPETRTVLEGAVKTAPNPPAVAPAKETTEAAIAAQAKAKGYDVGTYRSFLVKEGWKIK